MKKKIREAEYLIQKLVDETKKPVLCFGGGRESTSMLMLVRHLGLQEQIEVRLANTNPNSKDGIIQGLEVLIREMGFRVTVTLGLEPHDPLSPVLGDFEITTPVQALVSSRYGELTPGQTLQTNTNWAEAICGADGVLVGWRRDDRPPLDVLAVVIGSWGQCKDGRRFVLPLFSWTVDDLNAFLGSAPVIRVTPPAFDSFAQQRVERLARERDEWFKRQQVLDKA
jgi:hypothetical protein